MTYMLFWADLALQAAWYLSWWQYRIGPLYGHERPFARTFYHEIRPFYLLMVVYTHVVWPLTAHAPLLVRCWFGVLAVPAMRIWWLLDDDDDRWQRRRRKLAAAVRRAGARLVVVPQ